ncbi:Trk family potassium uptake protein [Lacrimispora sp. NSJ-141]|uniref:Trk family potassium uptake protein n=1 Tax=Lientehia hominis TaxID=2897778 RepID=A0AAP2RKD8_9FIRM|nr:potassium transporter TrkG [Lientehia hominis]MCD2493281.1 Trk family potassium uptake protein [Lientehia hominis]
MERGLTMEKVWKRVHRASPMKIIIAGYFFIILLGAGLLCLPISIKAGESLTSFSDALFTATSATCVTGLVRFDTYTHWSFFGQLVILLLIQVGGIGFMTFAIYAVSMTKKKIGLTTRVIMQNAISAPQVGGIVRMTRFILFGTFLIEGTGAVLLSLYFCPRLGFFEGIWYGIFHSISAFCNAGFDLMGKREPFSSLTTIGGNWYVNGIIMLLIIIGGLGFFVWRDLANNRFSLKKLRLHSKLVLVVTAGLIVFGALLLFVFEQGNADFVQMPFSQKGLSAIFQSVTARTAGFNSMDLAKMTQSSQFLLICLMLIGGSTGSTAGGVKTTTLAVFMVSIVSTMRQKKNMEVFGRRLDDGVIRLATCIFSMYLILSLTVAMALSSIEGIPLLTALFESASAVGTVGLTLGVTTGLGMVSKCLIMFLMFVGRVGSVTILVALASEKNRTVSKLPLEKIQVG